jgi:hypothetical protein
MSISRFGTAPPTQPGGEAPGAEKDGGLFSRALNRLKGKSNEAEQVNAPATMGPLAQDFPEEPQRPAVVRQKTERLTPPPTRRVMLIPARGTDAKTALDYMKNLPRDVRYVNEERQHVDGDPTKDEILDLNKPVIAIPRSESAESASGVKPDAA